MERQEKGETQVIRTPTEKTGKNGQRDKSHRTTMNSNSLI